MQQITSKVHVCKIESTFSLEIKGRQEERIADKKKEKNVKPKWWNDLILVVKKSDTACHPLNYCHWGLEQMHKNERIVLKYI